MLFRIALFLCSIFVGLHNILLRFSVPLSLREIRLKIVPYMTFRILIHFSVYKVFKFAAT